MKSEHFVWKAVNAQGKIEQGSWRGNEISDIQKSLRLKGYFPIKIRSNRNWPAISLFPVNFQWNVFTRRLATLLEAGIPLVQSLEMMTLQEGKLTSQQELWKDIKEQIQAGKDLSEVLSSLRTPPSQFILAMIKAGELTGTLGKVLREAADELEQEHLYRKKIIAALAYPGLLFFTLAFVLCVLSIWVLPMYERLFLSLGTDLPFLTRVIFGCGRKVPVFLEIGFILVLGGLLILRSGRLDHGKIYLQRMIGCLPLFGKIYRFRDLMQFSQIMERLLSAGVPLLDALRLTAGTLNRLDMNKLMTQLVRNVRQGDRLAPLLRKSRIFPKEGAEMIAIAEESGHLDQMLHFVKLMFQREYENHLNHLTRVIEPFFILLFAGVVGFVAAGVMLPIFEISSHLQ